MSRWSLGVDYTAFSGGVLNEREEFVKEACDIGVQQEEFRPQPYGVFDVQPQTI
jgi:hypothetical protein